MRTRADGVHGSKHEINQDRGGNVLVGTDLVVVDGDTFHLQVIVSFVKTTLVDTVLVGNDLPERGTYGCESENRGLMSVRRCFE